MTHLTNSNALSYCNFCLSGNCLANYLLEINVLYWACVGLLLDRKWSESPCKVFYGTHASAAALPTPQAVGRLQAPELISFWTILFAWFFASKPTKLIPHAGPWRLKLEVSQEQHFLNWVVHQNFIISTRERFCFCWCQVESKWRCGRNNKSSKFARIYTATDSFLVVKFSPAYLKHGKSRSRLIISAQPSQTVA